MNSEKFKDFLCTNAGRAVMIVVFYALILGFIAGTFGLLGDTVGFIVSLVFVVFGWKAINKLPLDFILVLPLVGWLIFYIVKFFIAALIGVFVAPFVIAKAITNKIQGSL